MIRVGVNPIGWSNDDLPTLGGHIPVEQCLREARAAGFAGIELGGKFPRDPQALRSLMLDHDLELISGWWGSRLLERTVEAELRALEPHLNLLAGMGCDVLVLAEVTGAVHPDPQVPWDRRPVLFPAALKQLAEQLTEVAEHVAQRGLRIAYHHHVGTVIQSAADVHALMRASGSALGLLVDTGHAVVAGVSPIELIEHHASRVRHVHLKDVRPGVLEVSQMKGASFLDAVQDGLFTVPGDGMIAWTDVFDALKAARYRGWLVVEAEQDPDKAAPAEYARMGFTHVQGHLSRLGWT